MNIDFEKMVKDEDFFYQTPSMREGVTTFIHVPARKEYEEGKEKLKIMEEVLKYLPYNEQIISDYHPTYIEDYPCLPISTLMDIKCAHAILPMCKRPVFFIGGYAFFRRYNDNYATTLLVSSPYRSHHKYIEWEGAVGKNFLSELRTLLHNKSPSEITSSEIQDILYA